MDIVKLVDFVKSGELFEKIEGEYEQIVSDFDFSKFEGVDGFLKVEKIGDIEKIDETKTTLFILYKLLPENIFKYFDLNKVTILDLNFGLSGYGNKIGLSKLDLGKLISKDISIYEPFDLLSLLGNISFDDKNTKKYIRINDFDLPGNFEVGDMQDILSMSDKGLSGGAFTILTTGAMLPEIVRVAHILNEHGLFVDVFILNKLNFTLDEKMKALLTHNANMMFVLDMVNSTIYENWVNSMLSGLNIKFIYPKYNDLTTVLDEYKFEEVGFDAVGLVESLK